MSTLVRITHLLLVDDVLLLGTGTLHEWFVYKGFL